MSNRRPVLFSDADVTEEALARLSDEALAALPAYASAALPKPAPGSDADIVAACRAVKNQHDALNRINGPDGATEDEAGAASDAWSDAVDALTDLRAVSPAAKATKAAMAKLVFVRDVAAQFEHGPVDAAAVGPRDLLAWSVFCDALAPDAPSTPELTPPEPTASPDDALSGKSLECALLTPALLPKTGEHPDAELLHSCAGILLLSRVTDTLGDTKDDTVQPLLQLRMRAAKMQPTTLLGLRALAFALLPTLGREAPAAGAEEALLHTLCRGLAALNAGNR